MSPDPAQTLDPSRGLVSEATIYLPNDVGLWRTVGHLANAADGVGQPGFSSVVGAFDVSRRLSMTRGAGEAVERFALASTPSDEEHLIVKDGSHEKRIDYVKAGLGHPSANEIDFPWYRATDLLTGDESHVPAPVVNFRPTLVEADDRVSDYFDPSPNGAASGPSLHFAKTAAVAEIIERDVFLRAWRNRTELNSVMPSSLPSTHADHPHARHLNRLLNAAQAAGIEATLAFVPNNGVPLETAVCVIIGNQQHAEFGAVGIKSAADPVSALRGALQEGLQIRELFLSRAGSATEVPPTVTDDDSRAAYWATREAVTELRQWVESFSESRLPVAHPDADVNVLVRSLAARGVSSHWVSLTHRLPQAIQELGWETGKAICLGTVQLTMDESKELPAQHGPYLGDSPKPNASVLRTPHPLI